MRGRYLLFFLHGPQLPWYGSFASELSNRSGIESVLWVWRNRDEARALSLDLFDNVVNITDGLKDHSPEYSVSLEHLREFEDAADGFSYSRALARDRTTRRRGLSREEIAHYASFAIRRMSMELEERGPPLAAFGENNRLIYEVAHHILDGGVPHLHHGTSRHWPNRFFWNEDQMWQWPRCRQLYSEYLRDGVPQKTKREAKQVLRSIRREGKQPYYMEFDRTEGTFFQYFRSLLSTASHPFNSSILPSRFSSRIDSARRLDFLNRKASRSPCRNVEQAAFFLHKEPESVVDGPSFLFRNQLAAVENVAAHLPADMELLVKEHEPMAGDRPLHFYKNVQSIPNARLVHPSVQSKRLIQKSKLVFTLAGTPALEAMYHGVPAMIFGDIFFREFKGIQKIDSFAELKEQIDLALNSDTTAKREQKIAAIAAMHDASYPGKIGPNHSDAEILSERNVALLASSVVEEVGL